MANLLEEASILLTPTAYDNGKMLAVKPEIALGEENVTNGDFATDSDWSKGSGVTISDGEALITVTNGGYQFLGQSVTYISGKSYTLTASVNGTIGSGCTFFDASGNNGGLNTSNGIVTFNGEKQYISFDFIANNNSNTVLITRNGTGDYSFSIDNVSVKEDVSGDFTFSRNSAATRVNAQGLVENVQILSSDLVSNGNFSQEGVQEVSNGSFSQEGVEQVTNGDFENWTADSPNNWTVVNEDANNYVTQDGTYAKIVSNDTSSIQIKQTIFTIGKTYRVDLDAVVNNGNVEGLKLNDATAAATIGYVNSTGHHTFYFKAEGTFFVINRKGGGNTDISIDNVSVKEVGQDWALGTGWSIGEDKAVANTTGNFVNLYQNSTFVVGKTYKTTFTISDYTQGSVRLTENGYDISGFQNAVGTYTTYFTASQTDLYMQGHSSFIGSITNISVKEVGQNWVVGSGWSIGDNKSTFNLSSGAGNVSQINVFESGKTYRITFDTLETNGGNLAYRIGAGGFVFINAIAANTKHTITETATSDGSFSLRGATNFNGSITNISVIEITDDTNLPRINYEGFSYQDSLGGEEVVNGDFATDTNWIKQANWSISGGNLLSTNSAQYVSANQNVSGITLGKTYQININVNSTSGGYIVKVGSSGSIYALSLGLNTITAVWNGINNGLAIYNNSSSTGNISIDNVSVKEYLGQEVVPNSGCGSWLLEPQSTNLITYSEDFSDASWGKSATTVSANSTISVDGTQNASLIQSTQTGSALVIITNPTLTVGNTYTFSCFAKKGNNDWIRLAHISSGGTGCWFDLENGVVGTVNSQSATIEDYGNGWYKCTNTFIATTSTGANLVFIGICDADGSTNAGIVGQNDYLWGAMLEQSSYATSYIPTQGATSTRLQDIANNSGNESLINSESGVLYAEIGSLIGDESVGQLSISDGTNNESVKILYLYANEVRLEMKTASGENFIKDITVTRDGTFDKVAIRYKSNDYAVYHNGIAQTVVQRADVASGLNVLAFNQGGASSPFYGKTKALAVFKTALTDASLRSLTYPPAVATTFDLNFNTIAEQFTFTRGSEATFVNAQGLIQSTASNDAPRLDYSTGSEAFLLEPQSTNLIPYSEDFSDSSWVKQASSVTSGFVSPNGTANAFKLTENTAFGSHYTQDQGISVTNSVNNSFSAFVKKGERSWVLLDNDNMSNVGAYFDIETGVVGTRLTSNIDAIITDIGSGWFKCTIVYLNTSTNSWCNIRICDADNSKNYQGDGTSGIYIYGAQLEQNSFATSYIPTSGASATRNQELCNNATPVINSEEGTLYAEISALANDNTSRVICLSNGTNSNRALVSYDASSNKILAFHNNGTDQVLLDFIVSDITNFHKVAFKFAENDYALWINGVEVATSLVGGVNIANTLDRLDFRNASGSSPFNGNTKGLKVYPKALADVQLQDLTTI